MAFSTHQFTNEPDSAQPRHDRMQRGILIDQLLNASAVLSSIFFIWYADKCWLIELWKRTEGDYVLRHRTRGGKKRLKKSQMWSKSYKTVRKHDVGKNPVCSDWSTERIRLRPPFYNCSAWIQNCLKGHQIFYMLPSQDKSQTFVIMTNCRISSIITFFILFIGAHTDVYMAD